jgi:hypothetical protein
MIVVLIAAVVVVIVALVVARSRRANDGVDSFRRQIDALSPEARRPVVDQVQNAAGRQPVAEVASDDDHAADNDDHAADDDDHAADDRGDDDQGGPRGA